VGTRGGRRRRRDVKKKDSLTLSAASAASSSSLSFLPFPLMLSTNTEQKILLLYQDQK